MMIHDVYIATYAIPRCVAEPIFSLAAGQHQAGIYSSLLGRFRPRMCQPKDQQTVEKMHLAHPGTQCEKFQHFKIFKQWLQWSPVCWLQMAPVSPSFPLKSPHDGLHIRTRRKWGLGSFTLSNGHLEGTMMYQKQHDSCSFEKHPIQIIQEFQIFLASCYQRVRPCRAAFVFVPGDFAVHRLPLALGCFDANGPGQRNAQRNAEPSHGDNGRRAHTGCVPRRGYCPNTVRSCSIQVRDHTGWVEFEFGKFWSFTRLSSVPVPARVWVWMEFGLGFELLCPKGLSPKSSSVE